VSFRPDIGVAIPTYRGSDQLRRSLPPVLRSPLAPRVLVVDSSSNDGTVEAARELGAETLVIPRSSFNHGATRELARRELGTEIVVMMTQDAYLLDEASLERLVEPVVSGTAAMSYGRQVARPEASLFESSLRDFNYPATSHVRSKADADRYGAYIFFASNAFAAWRNRELDEVGGFQPTLSHEDAVAAAMLLRAGHAIAYVAEAVVEHSHTYGLWDDFQRYFDAGYAREEYRSVFAFAGPHRDLGQRYAEELLALVVRTRPWLLPYAVAHLGTKWLGFFIGRNSLNAPDGLKRALSGQTYYWSSDSYLAGSRGHRTDLARVDGRL
jgi:rhamnosyltransferase